MEVIDAKLDGKLDGKLDVNHCKHGLSSIDAKLDGKLDINHCKHGRSSNEIEYHNIEAINSKLDDFFNDSTGNSIKIYRQIPRSLSGNNKALNDCLAKIYKVSFGMDGRNFIHDTIVTSKFIVNDRIYGD